MRSRATAIGAALALAIAACGSTEGIEIDGQWARTSPAMASAGAVYMNLTSAEGDRLIGASVDSSIAAKVEVHETRPADTEGSMGDEDSMEGMAPMMMQEVEAIELPAGETVNLEPGGFHIMLLELAEALELGQEFDLTLLFAEAGEQTITVEVRDEAP
jgi:copper(I)-binding protein